MRAALRGLAPVLVPVLVPVLLQAGPLAAEAASPEGTELTEAQGYARDVALMFLYHELGHALIDVLDAPVLRLEEDAADTLAVLLIDRYWEPDWAEQKARVAADFWAESAPSWSEDDPGDVVTWSTHSPDERRYFTFVCLFYGGNPAARAAFASDMGLPADRQETCPDEFELMAESWDRLLAPLAGSGATLRFEVQAEGYGFVAQALADEIAYMNDLVVLPQTLPVVLTACGEANAFYDPDVVAVTICTELVDEALALGGADTP